MGRSRKPSPTLAAAETDPSVERPGEAVDLRPGPPGAPPPPRFPKSRRPLTREEELRLARRVAGGDPEARQELILANQGLIWHVLHREFQAFSHLWDDLFQEGQVGLIKAVDRFDWRRGCRFSTYAVWWIRREIQLALGRWMAGAARLPEARRREARELNLTLRRLEDRLDRPPTPEEVAAELGTPVERVPELLAQAEVGSSPLSLDALEEAWGSVEFGPAPPSLEDESLALRMRHALWRAIRRSLTPRQREVLLLRYGLDPEGPGRPPVSQREVAARMNISPQAVSRLEERALARIKAEMDLLTGYFRRGE